MRYLAITLTALVLIWIIWAKTGHTGELPEVSGYMSLTEEIQPLTNDSTRGNIIGIQPFMLETDYLKAERFYNKMDTYFSEASAQGLILENSIVLLPEYLGTWLVIADEKISVAESSSLSAAMARLVLSNPISIFQHFNFKAEESDKIAATLFRMKAAKMAEIYADTFSRLAQEYQVHISAGSIILPASKIRGSKIEINSEANLYNTSFLFLPDGNIHPNEVKKAFPIDSEHPFVTASKSSEIPQYQLPFGKVGVLVCADSWYPESYEAMKGVDIVLVNSYCAIDGAMNLPWAGYNGSAAPKDVDFTDMGSLTEHEAWLKYALPGRLALSGATVGANVFLRGRLWDLGTDGQPFFIRGGELQHANPAEQGGIWSMQF
ncbi:MAG: carbon-nitrogen hydrolase [Mongoliibacter sp.]|uniref:nitrilase-related carbon-nitrogen hydrolase n=1 Tax=Mongoliibacter sp. TaxID=2022438 RepID=UPI0012F407AF|nr:nitrilase-related carbon-nitrogen hydrolase [Mongoliibacter sp.]TVP45315.1 MAG: carbon-nitrogen hydrolase [Mongoliibacter sp.]